MGFYYLYLILAYLLVMTGYNIYKSRHVKSQDDFMVAGRSLSLTKMVFTLVCTWIGSGTFIAGAEYASYAGWSAIWQPAGAFLGIAIIYFIAARIRTFGQYTVGDILEARYGRFARLFGAIALIIAFTTIVAYQFRAGGYILNVVTDGYISLEMGQTITAAVRHRVRHHRRDDRRGAHRPAERDHHRVGVPAGRCPSSSPPPAAGRTRTTSSGRPSSRCSRRTSGSTRR